MPEWCPRALALWLATLSGVFACTPTASPPASSEGPQAGEPAPVTSAPPPAPPSALDVGMGELTEAGQVLAWLDALNAGRLDEAALAFAPDVVWTVAAEPGLRVVGRDALVARWRFERAAFPDLRVAVRRLLDGDEALVLQTVVRGTHLGPLGGRQPTGRPVGYELLHVLQMDGGIIQRVATYGHPRAVEAQIAPHAADAPPVPEWPEAPEIVAGRGREGHVQAVHHLYEGIAAGDPAVIDATCAPDVVGLDRADGTRITGADQTKTWLMALHKAISPLELEAHDVVAVGPYVVATFVVAGRHGGDLGGGLASGRPVAVHGADVLRFGPGGIGAVEAYIDRAQLTRQLGLAPH